MELRRVSVRRGRQWALRDLSLRFEGGERWALIGGNGAGKTQLLKLLATDVWPTPSAAAARIYRSAGLEIDVIEAKARIAYLGAELQDKYARYEWNLAVADVVATGLHRTDLLLGRVTALQRRRVAVMLERCGIKSLRERRFLTLSYGQKRLALLARALVQKPDWLLLDEFYNGLDRAYRRRLDEVLEAARAGGQSWIAAAHRAADVPRGTRGIIELRAGRLLAMKRLEPRDLARLAAAAGEREPRRTAARVPRPPHTPGRSPGGALLRITAADLYVGYRAVLRNLTWEVRRGQQWAVFGANGAGKSSLLKMIYGDLSPALGGRLERIGFPRGTPIDAWKRRVGYVSPELQADYAVDVSVFELVASGRHASIGLCAAATAADRREARKWLRYFGLLSVAKRRPRELSYGQLRRALIARALAAAADMLLLDEPLTGLDPGQRAAMKRLLERLMARGVTLVIAVHHPEDLPRGMTHALRLHKRRALASDLRSAT